jgi:epoxyqueuosine reductase
VPCVRCRQGRFREDRGLNSPIANAQRIRDLALEVGFSRAGFVRPTEILHEADVSILVCCLSCYRREPDDLSTPEDPHGLIAPFARRNYYKTAVRMIRRLVMRLDEDFGIPRKSVRIFCNSRLPEKPLCVAAGLAWLGRNGLCLASGLGSLFIIAGAILPAPVPDSAVLELLPDRCGSCSRCMEACPTGAIIRPGILDRARCLQGLASAPGELPPEVMEKWEARLYGCQECQSVCPHNRGPLEEAPLAVGEIGPSVSLRWFLSLDRTSVERFLHGTAMGLSWISKEALVRNALIAAGNSRAPCLRASIEPFSSNGAPSLNSAAQWALKRLR